MAEPSYGLDTTAIGTTTAKSISFSGGAVGTTPVAITLNTVGAGTATSSAAGVAFSSLQSAFAAAASGTLTAADAYNSDPIWTGQSFDIFTLSAEGNSLNFAGNNFTANFNGKTTANLDGSGPLIDIADSNGIYTEHEAIAKINHDLAASGSTITASDPTTGGHITLSNGTPGAASNFQLYFTDPNGTGGLRPPRNYNVPYSTNGANAGAGVGFTINGSAITVDRAEMIAGSDASNGGINSVNLTAAINAKLASAGIANVVAVKSGTVGVSGANDTITLQATTPGPGTTFTLSNIIGSVVGGLATTTSSSAGAPYSALFSEMASSSAAYAIAAPYSTANAFTAGTQISFNGQTVTFDGTFHDRDGNQVQIADQVTYKYTIYEALMRIQWDAGGGGANILAWNNDGRIEIDDSSGATAALSSVAISGLGSLGAANGGFGNSDFTAANGTAQGSGASFTISVNGGTGHTITITPAEAAGYGLGGAVGPNGDATSMNLTAAINHHLAAAGITSVVAVKSGTPYVSAATDTITLQATTPGSGTTFAISNVIGSVVGSSVTAGTASSTTVTPGTNGGGGSGSVKTVDQLVSDINANASLVGKVRASNNAGQLQITDLSTAALTVTGVTTGGTIDGGSGTTTVAANTTRHNLVVQFNQLKDQLDKTAQDASFNGINLLVGDQLKLYFNENSTSSITIQSTNTVGINSSVLGAVSATDAEFQSNTSLDTRLQSLQGAVTTVASQASAFGNNLAIVQNRQTFTNAMINTLQTGADGLTLADTNLEGANMLSLQTSQQLSIQALSLASQSNQAVLRLFG